MKTKLHNALSMALPRFLLGILGTWCVLGPILLFNASAATGWGLTAVLVLLLFLGYAVVLIICLRAHWNTLKDLFLETRLALCFMIVGLLVNEMTGIFITVKHRLVIVYAFVGFFIAELIKPWGFGKILADLRGKQTTNSGERATATGRATADLTMAAATQERALAAEMADPSSRPTEDQRILTEQEKQQGRLVSLETHSQYLEDMINSVRSQLNESTIGIREAADRSASLEGEIAALKQQIAEGDAVTASFQSLAQCVAKIQFENQEIRFADRRLREELDKQRSQLSVSNNRLQELVRSNQVLADRHERLDAEVAGLKQSLRNSQPMNQAIPAVRQQLATVDARAAIDREQQQGLEARIVAIEHELSERKTRMKQFNDALERLRETARACQDLAENNRRLWKIVSVWQQGLAAQDQRQRQGQQIRKSETEQARFITDERAAPRGVAGAALLFNPPSFPEVDVQRTISGTAIAQHGSVNSIAGTYREKPEEAAWVPWISLKSQWRFAETAAGVILIAGVVVMGVLHAKFSASKPVEVKAVTVAPETNFQKPTVERVSSRPIKPAPRLQGTFMTVRPTQLYSGPSENAAFIADIDAGMMLNVVDSSYGWLEIRSKHGRPPGFVRQDATVRVVPN